jgi:prefoldin subunit 5
MTDINLQEYGRLEQQVEQLTKDVEEMQADIKAIKALLEQASGGWKTLVWVGGAAAAGATALQWVASHVSLK